MKPQRQCLQCGRVSDQSRCDRHRLPDRRPSPAARGYDAAWRKLSKAARSAQPWCTDCGTTADLTADHLRWPALSLDDVEVVCRSCNSRRGAVRTGGMIPRETASPSTRPIPSEPLSLGGIA